MSAQPDQKIHVITSLLIRDQATGRLGKIVFLQDQTSPCSEMREKFKCTCIEYIKQ